MSGTARFERRERIRFGACDPAGIVFYPQYFVLFNALVEDWVSDVLGIPYAELIGARRTGLPTVSLHTDFRAVSRLGDEVTFGLAVERLGTRSFTLALAAHAGPELRVRTRQVIVCTSLATHRAVMLPADLRAAIERFRAGGVRQGASASAP
jgi:4-hydroxybenzoyl-CoA thioesterase